MTTSPRFWLTLCITLWVCFSALPMPTVLAQPPASESIDGFTVYLPLVTRPGFNNPPADINNTLDYINYFRALAGSPPVTYNATLNSQCFDHARYMAENNILTHSSSAGNGLNCAQNGNAWLGGAFGTPYWQPHHAIDGWMRSTGHRLWLLYPTTPTFGFDFYTHDNNRAGAALNVISNANFNADTSYTNWPVRYPAAGQTGVPAEAYPITLNWRYFGNAPSISSTSLSVNGQPVAHTSTNELPVGHEGIEIKPTHAFPRNATVVVTVNGSYNGVAFNYAWSFTTAP